MFNLKLQALDHVDFLIRDNSSQTVRFSFNKKCSWCWQTCATR